MNTTTKTLELQGQPDTEVYASDSGYVCIKQSNGFEDPSVVVITPQLVDEVCKMMKSVVVEAYDARASYLSSKGLK